MDIYEAIRTRKSVRKFLGKQVEDDKLNRILEAGRLAPSARNLQEWRYLVVRDDELRRGLIDAAAGQRFVGQAPVVIVCCAETDGHVMRCGERCYPIDVAVSVDHMTLAAAAEGLGTCWIGAFYQDQVKHLLGIPEEIRVVALLPLGYPADPKPIEKSRMGLDEFVRYERW
ncbi:MAG: nitroreductase family protein [Spirochaetia bacterium]